MKKIFLIILTSLVFLSCSGFQDAAKVLRNEKIKSTDEFLVKKKEPLVLPPDYNKIPEPGSLSKKKESENEDRIKTYYVDQTNPDTIDKMFNEIGVDYFDVILEDGLHEFNANICFLYYNFWRKCSYKLISWSFWCL